MHFRHVILTFLVCFGIGFGLATATETGPTLQQVQAGMLRCQAQLFQAQADVLDGKLLTWERVKTEIEAANPGKVFDVTAKTLK